LRGLPAIKVIVAFADGPSVLDLLVAIGATAVIGLWMLLATNWLS
jgi:hypothetical protein